MKFAIYTLVEVCALALSVNVFSAGAEEAAAPACHLQRAAYMDLLPDPAHMPLVAGSVAGKPIRFLVDTSGVFSSIRPDVADRLKLKHKPMPLGIAFIHATSGKREPSIAVAKDFALGPLKLPSKELIVMQSGLEDADFDGLIAGEMLHIFDVEFDPVKKKLSLFMPAHCGVRSIYWTRQGLYAAIPFLSDDRSDNVVVRSWHITFPAKLDGHDVDVTLDTGSDHTFMLMSEAEKILSDKQMSDLQKQKDISDDHGESRRYMATFKALDLGDIQVGNPSIEVIKPGKYYRKDYHHKAQITLGQDVLSKLHMYIAYADHKIYFTPAGAH